MVLSTALLLSVHSVNAGEALSSLTSTKAQQLSRDLIQPNSQDFFRQGHVVLDREIQILQQRRLSSTKPPLNIIDKVPPVEKEPPLKRGEER